MLLLSLSVLTLWTGVMAEIVFIDDLTSTRARRSIDDLDLLSFRLRHSGGILDLNLRENKRLNSGAPIFVSKTDPIGYKRIVEVDTPVSQVKHYQDKRNGAYMSVGCYPAPHGPCVRSLKGNVVIDGKEYKLEPVERETGAYLLEELEQELNNMSSLSDGKIAGIVNDAIVPPDEQKRGEAKFQANKRSNILRRGLLRLERMLNRPKRQTTGPVAHGIEMLMVIDHVIYQNFDELYDGEDEIRLRIREYFSHIINGVDLRYASIQEDDISFYVTVSGFFISKNDSESTWMDYSPTNPDGFEGLQGLKTFRQDTSKDLPAHDHAALITGANIQYSGSNGVAGLAYLDGVCTDNRVSVSEDISIFKTAGILAHELGHNLGANHDGSSDTCDPDAKFIMQPYVPSLSATSTTINPWRFSTCSISQFRDYISSLGEDDCTLNQGTVYNETEFNLHTAGLAGQIYSEDEQCELLNGANSQACQGTTNIPEVCRNLECTDGATGDCDSSFIAAHGTPCGSDMICFEGLCVDPALTTNAPVTTTQAPATTTQAPVTTTQPPVTTTQAPVTTTQAPATTTKAPVTTTQPPVTKTQAPVTTTQAPSTTTEAPVTTISSEGTTNPTVCPTKPTPDGFQCIDHFKFCSKLVFWVGRFNACRFRSYECCASCTTFETCEGEQEFRNGKTTYTCDALEKELGFDTTCTFFTYECCKRCGKGSRRKTED